MSESEKHPEVEIDPSRLYTLAKLATYCGLTGERRIRTLREKLQAGGFPARKVGRSDWLTGKEFIAFVESQSKPAAETL